MAINLPMPTNHNVRLHKNYVGHCKVNKNGSSSDKVYIVTIDERKSGQYRIVGWWGRRGSELTRSDKQICYSMTEAVGVAHELFVEKLDKGYVDVTSQFYTGEVTIDSVKKYFLNDEGYPEKDDQLFDGPETDEEVIATCLSNKGYEDQFDVGVEYIVRTASSARGTTLRDCIQLSDTIGVEDRFGEVVEFDNNDTMFKINKK